MTQPSYKQYPVSLDEATHIKLEKVAKANFRSMTGQIRFWVHQAETKEQPHTKGQIIARLSTLFYVKYPPSGFPRQTSKKEQTSKQANLPSLPAQDAVHISRQKRQASKSGTSYFISSLLLACLGRRAKRAVHQGSSRDQEKIDKQAQFVLAYMGEIVQKVRVVRVIWDRDNSSKEGRNYINQGSCVIC